MFKTNGQKEKYKKGENNHGSLKKPKTFANPSHPPCTLCHNRENGKKSIEKLVIDNGLTIVMKSVSKHAT